jgi:hypothetical protein
LTYDPETSIAILGSGCSFPVSPEPKYKFIVLGTLGHRLDFQYFDETLETISAFISTHLIDDIFVVAKEVAISDILAYLLGQCSKNIWVFEDSTKSFRCLTK